MRQSHFIKFIKFSLFLIIIYWPHTSSAKTYILSPSAVIGWNDLDLSKKTKGHLYEAPYVKSEINSYEDKKEQSLDYMIAGLHSKSCSRALVKLSQYERYSEFIGFIKKSEYSDQTKRINFDLSHTLMPFNMTLYFQLERITTPGVYTFSFDSGFLRSLKGKIHVSEHKNRCLFVTKAYWRGPETKIPDSIFSFFSSALGKMAMKRLFQVSQTL